MMCVTLMPQRTEMKTAACWNCRPCLHCVESPFCLKSSVPALSADPQRLNSFCTHLNLSILML